MDTHRVAKKRIVAIGGGTGTFVTLSGLKSYPFSLQAIVSMSDSGGSNKRIRDEFGLLPTSDIRQCLIALADEKGATGVLRQLFMYRFEKGKGISGMTFGNLFMAALSDIAGSQREAIAQTGKVLRIRGEVIPVTYSNTNLYAVYENGKVVTEEHFIDEPTHDGTLKITKIYLKPSAQPNEDALGAIENADLIILGPGDLYTSLIPNLLVARIGEAIRQSRAKKVYVMNLMTKFGQTYNFTAKDHIHILEQHIGKSLDYVLVNTRKYPQPVLKKYKTMNEYPVIDDLIGKAYYKVMRKPLIKGDIMKKSSVDMLVRSLIRHDSDLLAKQLSSLV